MAGQTVAVGIRRLVLNGLRLQQKALREGHNERDELVGRQNHERGCMVNLNGTASIQKRLVGIVFVRYWMLWSIVTFC